MSNREKALEAALRAIVEEQCDYMRINHLGDPERQHNIKLARAALATPATVDRWEAGRDAAAAECDMCPDQHWGPWLAKRIRNLTPPEDAP
jgi:hypothetical protein